MTLIVTAAERRVRAAAAPLPSTSTEPGAAAAAANGALAAAAAAAAGGEGEGRAGWAREVAESAASALLSAALDGEKRDDITALVAVFL